jgi:integrase
MLTGQCRQEIGGLEWPEVRLQQAMIDLPPARTMNKKRHLIPLSEPALALLPATGAHQRFVFGEFAGYADWSRDKARLDKRVELPPWTLHDIRRTFVTNVNELGFAEPHIVEAMVNHISGTKSGVAGRYNHAQYLEQRREALDKWGRYLTGLVGCPLSSRQLQLHREI